MKSKVFILSFVLILGLIMFAGIISASQITSEFFPVKWGTCQETVKDCGVKSDNTNDGWGTPQNACSLNSETADWAHGYNACELKIFTNANYDLDFDSIENVKVKVYFTPRGSSHAGQKVSVGLRVGSVVYKKSIDVTSHSPQEIDLTDLKSWTPEDLINSQIYIKMIDNDIDFSVDYAKLIVTGESSEPECTVNSDCGEETYSEDYCSNNNVARDHLIPTCTNEQCAVTQETDILQTCEFGCSNGACLSENESVCGNGILESDEECDDGNTNNFDVCSNECEIQHINCYFVSDCGINSWSNAYCNANDSHMYSDFLEWTCNNPGASNSFCTFTITPVMDGTCSNPYQCADGIDNDNDGLIDMNDPGCTSPADNDEYNAPIIPCNNNSQCGTNSWMGNTICKNGNVWQNYKQFTCNNAGLINSSCSNSVSLKLKEDCDNGCSNGACKEEDEDDDEDDEGISEPDDNMISLDELFDMKTYLGTGSDFNNATINLGSLSEDSGSNSAKSGSISIGFWMIIGIILIVLLIILIIAAVGGRY